jgi:hypothetical protein
VGVEVRAGRPKAMQSRPVFMDAVFDDPDHAMRLIRETAPYPTLTAHYDAPPGSQYDGQALFRHAMTDDTFLHNPNWIAAARQCFGAGIVQPIRCLLNLNAPMDEMGAHIDLPTFRGFTPGVEMRGLLMAMIHSGLFYDWMVQFASGLAWFYAGEGGEFLYWDDGIEAPPHIVRPPLWNVGVMSDNEAMFHAVAGVGQPQERERFAALIRRNDRLFPVGSDAWEIRDDERVGARLEATELRMSLLWKARVFRDEAHLASFEDSALDLTPETIAEVFLEDLAARDIAVKQPSDPLAADWQDFLAQTYPPPFTPKTADYVAGTG